MKKRAIYLFGFFLMASMIWGDTFSPDSIVRDASTKVVIDSLGRIMPYKSWGGINSQWYAYLIPGASTYFRTVPVLVDGLYYAQYQPIILGNVNTTPSWSDGNTVLTNGNRITSTAFTAPGNTVSAVGGVHGMEGTIWPSTLPASSSVLSTSWVQDSTWALFQPLPAMAIGAEGILSNSAFIIAGMNRVEVYGTTGVTYTTGRSVTGIGKEIRSATRLILLGLSK